MGNSIQKKFDVPKDHTASAGHLRLWKIWPGKAKEGSGNSAGQSVSIWTFDKNELLKKKDKNDKGLDKNVVEQIYQIMKKDLTVIKESQGCPHLISSIEVRVMTKYRQMSYYCVDR